MHIGGDPRLRPAAGRRHADPRRGCASTSSAASAALPRYRQRLSEPAHRRAALAGVGARRALRHRRARAPRRAARPRRRARAARLGGATSGRTASTAAGRCGSVVLLEGLAGGRWALATKTHHCLVDGVGSVDVGTVLLDAAARAGARWHGPAPRTSRPEADRPGPSRRLAVGRVRGHRAGVGAGAPSAARRARRSSARPRARRAARPRRARRRAAHQPQRPDRRAPPHRACRRAARRRSRRSSARSAAPSTTSCSPSSPAACATCSSRAARRRRPPGLRAMVPVNIRAAAEHLGARQPHHARCSSTCRSPSAEPRRALRARARRDRALKRGAPGGRRAALLVDLAGLAPPVLHGVLARALFATRLFNVTVTNVPGPPSPLYAFGAPMRRVIPLVPLAAEHAVGIATLSYDGASASACTPTATRCPTSSVIAAGIDGRAAGAARAVHRDRRAHAT